MRNALALLFSGLLPLSALAQEARGVDIQLFRPAVDSRGLLTKNRSDTLAQKDVSFGMWINGAQNPLVLNTQEIAEAIVTANFHGSIGIFNFLEAGLNLPVSLVNGPNADPLGGGPLAAQGIGDLSLHLKGTILPQRKFGVGVGALFRVSLPTGNEDFMSSNTTTLAPELIVDTILARRVKLAVNAGALLRNQPGEVISNINGVSNVELSVGNQVYLGGGAAFVVVPERLDLVAEIQALDDLTQENALTTPIEATAGIKLFLQRNSFFTAGVGVGLNDAYGAPDFRGFLGITFEPLIGDRDGDGYKDNGDKCPDEPEDFDGFQDEDGCPDPDNDDDGILDIDDKCPMVPGPMVNRGCPLKPKDGDRDGDGFLDKLDKCPDEAEDFDGFQDGDGCPELDNDDDTILDSNDNCPYEAEDFDNFEDEDGCPERDNDQDTILDTDDKCPLQAEDFDEVEDDDGCPEGLKKPKLDTTSRTFVLDPIYFDYNKATIKKESYDTLLALAGELNANSQYTRIRVEGHTDSDGSDKYNLKLSDERAKAVVAFLIKEGNVSKERLFGKGYGEGCPVGPNDNADNKSRNRRSEFVLLDEGEDPFGTCRAQKTQGK
jgi:OOP family OmpA-OmpF porin